MSEPAVVERLAGLIASFAHEMPEEVRTAARHSMLDWIGCAVAGSREPASEIIRAEVADHPLGVTIIGDARHATTVDAALANGIAGHALDFDDTNLAMRGHPTAAVLPAVLAVAERGDRSAADAVTALIVGTEIAVRVADMLGPDHYDRGWHTTGTAGVVGAAAATGWLLGLSEPYLVNALAIAVSQAGGLRASFGTMTKPLHAGRAAADGLLAALLARRGFTGRGTVIEHAQGFAVATLAEPELGRPDLHIGRWFTTETHFKLHAACYGTHAAIDAALAAQKAAGLAADDIVDVRVRVPPHLMGVCNIVEPVTGLEGKFSLRVAVALALLGADTGDIGQFTDARVADVDVVSLRDRIDILPDALLPPSASRVQIRGPGSVAAGAGPIECTADSSVRAGDRAAERDRLGAKFLSLTRPVIGVDRANALIDILDLVEGVPTRSVLALTAAS